MRCQLAGALWVPLRAEWFEQFRTGTKRVEWRAYGPRWNVDTIRPGRPIVLGRGYSGPRLTGIVTRVERVARDLAPPSALATYPDAEHFCAVHVALDSDGIESS